MEGENMEEGECIMIWIVRVYYKGVGGRVYQKGVVGGRVYYKGVVGGRVY